MIEPPLDATNPDEIRLRSTEDLEDLKSRSPEERRRTYLNMLAGAVFVIGFSILRPQLAVNIVGFLVMLGVLVFVHEWGHYQFARWAGMKVNRFAIGFPPFIYTRHKNGIAYSIGALPIGGMVDIAGLGSEEEMVAQAKGEEVEQPTRRANPTAPFGERQFQDANFFWRFMTLFAGPMMNFLFAIVVFISVFSIKGLPNERMSPSVGSVTAGLPAAIGGLQANDLIVSVNHKAVQYLEEVSPLVRANGLKPMQVGVSRDGRIVNLAMTPVMRDVDGDGVKEPSIGVAFDPKTLRVDWTPMPPGEAVKAGFSQSIGVSLTILDTIKRAFTRQLSSEEVKGIGGPVKIAQATGQAIQHGPWVLISFAAVLSVNLGLMNLLPVPALDGGRILFIFIGTIYEAVVRRPLDPRKETYVHLAGMVLLLGFMLFITLRDVLSFI